MFNLLVIYEQDRWNGEPYTYDLTRAINGYTEENLREELSNFSTDAIEKLKSLPCLFVYEYQDRENPLPAQIGWITEIRKRQASVAIAYDLDPSFPPIPAASIEQLAWEFDLGRFETTNTHWSVKNVDLFSVLIEAELIDRATVEALPAIRQQGIQPPITDIQVRPTVFRIPPTPIEEDLVSVMMPFNPEFSGVFTALSEECVRLGYRCQRADGIWGEEEVFQDIFSLIYRSKIVICDFTGRNPNVFYEAGIAHTLGRTVIPITQSNNDVPFDLQHYRYVPYLNNAQGLNTLQESIRPRLQGLAIAA